MADNNYWKGTASGDWSVAGNWSAGHEPVAGEDVYVLVGSVDISSGYPGVGNGVNYNSLKIGGQFTGKLATAALPFYMGDIGELIVDSGKSAEVFLAVDSGSDIVRTIVRNCSFGTYGCHLGEGGYGDVVVYTNGLLTFGSGATADKLYTPMSNRVPRIQILDGATITEAEIYTGVINNFASWAQHSQEIRVHGGQFNHVATSSYNIHSLILGGGRFNFHVGNIIDNSTPTIASVVHLNGIFDLDGGDGCERSVGNYTRYGGTLVSGNLGETVTFDNTAIYGGGETTGQNNTETSSFGTGMVAGI